MNFYWFKLALARLNLKDNLKQDEFILYVETLEQIKIYTSKFVSHFSQLNSNLYKIYKFATALK
jgi:hypothetical protein